jgi:hypothetical protein
MDSHFDEMLRGDGPSSAGRVSEYIPSRHFAGARPGYVFKNGNKGVGYYLDRVGTSYDAAVALKRQRTEDTVSEPIVTKSVVADQRANINKILEEADKVEAEPLTADTLNQVFS